MDVLLVGSDNQLMKALINKLNKEGHCPYVLTGSRDKNSAYKNAYERYRFPYDNDCLKEIVDSVRPDVTIFLGCYDFNFDWTDARKESVRYLTALQNILSSFALLGSGRFIYLSSEEVFAQPHKEDIAEDEPVSAISFRGVAIAQGEEVCQNYRKRMNTDTVVLRLDHLYTLPEPKASESPYHIQNSICTRMSIEAIQTGRIRANASKIFSMLYVDDAVEAIYKALIREKTDKSLYHISSGECIDELSLAGGIQKAMGDKVTITDNTSGNPMRIVLDSRAFAAEFGLTVFHHVQEVAKQTAAYVKKYSHEYVETEEEDRDTVRDIGQRLLVIAKALIPFAENFICFIPFFMLNNRAVGSAYFANLDFYLLYVLLFAVVYGQHQATFSAVLSVAGYCFRQMYNRPGLDVLLD